MPNTAKVRTEVGVKAKRSSGVSRKEDHSSTKRFGFTFILPIACAALRRIAEGGGSSG